MEHAIPEFMQYGAMGILALGFLVLLILYWKSDKRAELYARNLAAASTDRTVLIEVVKENSKASTALANQLAVMGQQLGRMAELHDKHSRVIEELAERLAKNRCPLENDPDLADRMRA